MTLEPPYDPTTMAAPSTPAMTRILYQGVRQPEANAGRGVVRLVMRLNVNPMLNPPVYMNAGTAAVLQPRCESRLMQTQPDLCPRSDVTLHRRAMSRFFSTLSLVAMAFCAQASQPAPARADRSFDFMLTPQTTDAYSMVTIERAQTPQQYEFGIQTSFGWAHSPFSPTLPSATAGHQRAALPADRQTSSRSTWDSSSA